MEETLKTKVHASPKLCKLVAAVLILGLSVQGRAEVVRRDGALQFALNSYRVLSEQKGNISFSPYSVSAALAMAASGADQKTLDEMKTVLGLGPTFAQDFKSQEAALRAGRGVELSIVNRIWLNMSDSVLPSFTSGLVENFNAELGQLDFRQKAEISRQTINAWVEEKTKLKVKDLVPLGAITPSTELVLTNAIYLKGEWLSAFDVHQTHKDFFSQSPQKRSKVSFMRQQHSFRFFADKEVQLVELPYQTGDFSFVVVMPSLKTGLAKLESGLNAEKLRFWFESMQAEKIALSLPRFKIEFKADLAKMLKALGMPQAFSPEVADFSKIQPIKPGQRLYLSAVFHKAYVDVTEAGTEAAAASAAVMMLGAGLSPKKPIEFKANRPFLYFIRHRATGTILFMGRLASI